MTITEDRIALYDSNRSALLAACIALPKSELKADLLAMCNNPNIKNAAIAHAYWIGTGGAPPEPE
jgi:hypothetical protein